METSEIAKPYVTITITPQSFQQSLRALMQASNESAKALYELGIDMQRSVQFLPARLREQRRQIQWLIRPHLRPVARKKLRRACRASTSKQQGTNVLPKLYPLWRARNVVGY